MYDPVAIANNVEIQQMSPTKVGQQIKITSRTPTQAIDLQVLSDRRLRILVFSVMIIGLKKGIYDRVERRVKELGYTEVEVLTDDPEEVEFYLSQGYVHVSGNRYIKKIR